MLPTDAWGTVLSVDLTEHEQTLWEDGWDDGYEAGYTAALVQACGVVTALFVANADPAEPDPED
jgi:hypothetical protein